MKIWLIRHGLTRLGEEKRYQGRIDEGLSDRGRTELCRAENPNTGVFPAYVYVSPALRARETAAILFPKAEQVLIPGLREMDFGAFEGRGWWEMEEDVSYREWVDGGCRGRCPGGEDREAFSKRACAAFQSILEKEIYRRKELSKESVLYRYTGTSRAGEAFSGEAFLEEAFSGEAFSGEAFSEEAFSGEAFSEETFSKEAPEMQIVIVAHGGTQMAVLEKWGRPAREYFSWQTPCGCGWLLEWEGETGLLKALEEVCFLRPA